ncbi:MAG: Gfo/Idh/MocA family oxidoreductase [Planctomycetota bacterium]
MFRWGILGCGDIAQKRVAGAILEDSRSTLLGACRRDTNLLKTFAQQFDVMFVTSDASELVTHPEIDAVYIATPVHLHCEQTIAAANAGKHVLVEKPMALDADQCEQMVGACRASKTTLGVAYYRPFYPAIRRIREILLSGTLGRPLSALVTTGNPNRFPPDDWRVVRSRGGGGPLMDIGSHRLDLLIDLFGYPTEVAGLTTSSPTFESEQAATAVMKFESQCIGTLQCYFGTTNTPDRLEIIATDGRVQIEDLNGGELLLHDSNGTHHESHPPATNFHAPLIADFTAALTTGSDPTVTGERGMQTNRLLESIYRTAKW